MSVTVTENLNTPNGFSVTTETIAKGTLRIKTKIWVDHLEIDTGVKEAVDLYEKTLKEFRDRGFKIDGDQ